MHCITVWNSLAGKQPVNLQMECSGASSEHLKNVDVGNLPGHKPCQLPETVRCHAYLLDRLRRILSADPLYPPPNREVWFR